MSCICGLDVDFVASALLCSIQCHCLPTAIRSFNSSHNHVLALQAQLSGLLHLPCAITARWAPAAQVYMHPDQLAHCLRDADIMDLVNKAQLKLVLIDNFPEIFNFCRRAQPGKSINSSRAEEAKVGPASWLLYCAALHQRMHLVHCSSAAGTARPLRGQKPQQCCSRATPSFSLCDTYGRAYGRVLVSLFARSHSCCLTPVCTRGTPYPLSLSYLSESIPSPYPDPKLKPDP